MIKVVQIVIAALLIALILLQQQGSGLGTAWGGEGVSYHTKQGMEKLLLRATILLVILFVLVSIYSLV